MADSSTQQQSDQQQQQGTTMTQGDQSQFDTSFLEQITHSYGSGSQTVDWAREYFDSIEQQVRSARRVAEVSALSQIQRQIVSQTAALVKQQVLSEIRNNPQLLRQGGSSQR